MEITPVGMVFRSVAVLIALIVAFLSYKIYSETKGVLGWLYLSLAGTFLFLWATTIQLFSFIDLPKTRYLSGAITLALMAFFVPVAYTKLAESFKIYKPRWLTTNFSACFVICVFLLILVVNLFRWSFSLSEISLFMRVLGSVSHATIGVSLAFAVIPTYYLMKATRRSPWVLAFLFCIFVAFGLNLGQYYSTCCWEESPMGQAQEKVCSQYKMDYVPVYGAGCVGSILIVGGYYQIFLIIGLVLGATSFYQLWRRISLASQA